MLLQEAMRARRSVRRYAKRRVNLEQLLVLVDCGRHAPTAANLQAWEFVLVQEPGAVEALVSVAPGISAGAQAIIAICVDREKARHKAGEGGEFFGLMDACFAAENILLAAADTGLGACVIRSFHQDAARSLLGLPDRVVPELLITLGYPEGPVPRGPKRRDMDDILHLDHWGRRRERPVVSSTVGTPTAAIAAEASGEAEAAAPPAIGLAAQPSGTSGAGTAPSGLRAALTRHLGYLAASARGLLAEPPAYGPYRLVDSLGRLIALMDDFGLADQTLLDARRLIEEGKLSVMDDAESFRRLVDEVLRILVARPALGQPADGPRPS